MKPITPAEVGPAKLGVTPPEVTQAFNELIAAHWDGSSATVEQREAVDRIVEAMQTETPYGNNGVEIEQRIHAKDWLNIEALYRSAGWKVVYDKPSYGETYPATFTFSRP